MRSERLRSSTGAGLVALTLALAAACGGDDTKGRTSSGAGGAGTGGMGTGGVPEPTPISAKATVKLKTRERLIADLAQTLSLSSDELCKELGSYDCGEVHAIALGADAYGAGVSEPLKSSAVTTPIAVDRLVLSACQLRAHRDIGTPKAAALYVGLDIVDGKLSDVESAPVTDALRNLYHRGHLRDPKPTELAHLQQLYLDVEAAGSPTPARDWAALSCYAVLTTMESVFY